MKFSYRTDHNARAVAAYWNKTLEARTCYKLEAQAEDSAEILIYDLIGWPFNNAGEFVRTLSGLTSKIITIRINSQGGDLFDANAIYNAIRSHKSKIVTRIESLAASAASVIAVAGKEVQMYKNAMFMIHNAWMAVIGDPEELRAAADIGDQVITNMIDGYADNSNVGKREIRDMMKVETWLNAKLSKEKGFVDTIIDGNAVKAEFDLSMFVHAPDDLFPGGPREPTERETEKTLRDAGYSRADAKAALSFLAGRKKVGAQDDECLKETRNLINKITGGK